MDKTQGMEPPRGVKTSGEDSGTESRKGPGAGRPSRTVRMFTYGVLAAILLAGGLTLALGLGQHVGRPVGGRLSTGTASMPKVHPTHPLGHSEHATTTAETYYPPLGEATPPVTGPVITGFGWVYSKPLGAYAYHPGWAFGATLGESVRAVLGGRVVANWVDPTEGREAVIDSRNGDSLVYGDLAGSGPAVGTRVNAGQVFGAVGPVGRLSQAEPVHLFLGLTVNGHPVSPMVLLSGKVPSVH